MHWEKSQHQCTAQPLPSRNPRPNPCPNTRPRQPRTWAWLSRQLPTPAPPIPLESSTGWPTGGYKTAAARATTPGKRRSRLPAAAVRNEGCSAVRAPIAPCSGLRFISPTAGLWPVPCWRPVGWAVLLPGVGGSRGVTHGELSSPFPNREEHRRGRGYPPARQGCSRGRKKGIFRRPDRAGLGPDVAPLSPPASPEQFGNILGGDNQTLAGAERWGLLPVPRRKPRARGAGFSVLPSLTGRREVGLHPPVQGHGGVPQDPHE